MSRIKSIIQNIWSGKDKKKELYQEVKWLLKQQLASTNLERVGYINAIITELLDVYPDDKVLSIGQFWIKPITEEEIDRLPLEKILEEYVNQESKQFQGILEFCYENNLLG